MSRNANSAYTTSNTTSGIWGGGSTYWAWCTWGLAWGLNKCFYFSFPFVRSPAFSCPASYDCSPACPVQDAGERAPASPPPPASAAAEGDAALIGNPHSRNAAGIFLSFDHWLNLKTTNQDINQETILKNTVFNIFRGGGWGLWWPWSPMSYFSCGFFSHLPKVSVFVSPFLHFLSLFYNFLFEFGLNLANFFSIHIMICT